MMHLLRKYDVARYSRNDAMFANSLGEADIIHEVNIISDSDIICRRQTSFQKRTGEKPLILLGSPRFSLRIYYNIKRHSLQHKNAESSLEIYNGNAKQTPAKLQPLSNNIFS